MPASGRLSVEEEGLRLDTVGHGRSMMEKTVTSIGQLDEWLDSWSSGYKSARLQNSDIQDYGNFEFICRMILTKDGGLEVKREFKMKAFFETNQWLVKEVRVSCDV